MRRGMNGRGRGREKKSTIGVSILRTSKLEKRGVSEGISVCSGAEGVGDLMSGRSRVHAWKDAPKRSEDKKKKKVAESFCNQLSKRRFNTEGTIDRHTLTQNEYTTYSSTDGTPIVYQQYKNHTEDTPQTEFSNPETNVLSITKIYITLYMHTMQCTQHCGILKNRLS